MPGLRYCGPAVLSIIGLKPQQITLDPGGPTGMSGSKGRTTARSLLARSKQAATMKKLFPPQATMSAFVYSDYQKIKYRV